MADERMWVAERQFLQKEAKCNYILEKEEFKSAFSFFIYSCLTACFLKKTHLSVKYVRAKA